MCLHLIWAGLPGRFLRNVLIADVTVLVSHSMLSSRLRLSHRLRSRPIVMSLVTLLATPTTRYMPWSSRPRPSSAATHDVMKLKPDSSRKVWFALLSLPPGTAAYGGSVPSRACMQK